MGNHFVLGKLSGIPGEYRDVRVLGDEDGFYLEAPQGLHSITQEHLLQLASQGNIRWVNQETEDWACNMLGISPAPRAETISYGGPLVGDKKIRPPKKEWGFWIKPALKMTITILLVVLLIGGGYTILSKAKWGGDNKNKQQNVVQDRNFVLPEVDFRYDIVETKASFPKGAVVQTLVFYAKNPSQKNIQTLQFRATLVKEGGQEVPIGDNLSSGLAFNQWRAGEWRVVRINADQFVGNQDKIVAIKDIQLRKTSQNPKGYTLSSGQNPNVSCPIKITLPGKGKASAEPGIPNDKYVMMGIQNQGKKNLGFCLNVYFTKAGHIVGMGNLNSPMNSSNTLPVMEAGKSLEVKLYPVSVGYSTAGYSYDWDGYIYSYDYAQTK